MPDFAEPAADAPDPAAALAATLAARVEAYRRGQIVVDYANRGVPIPEIAARLGIPEAEARKKLREALARALPETPEEFVALQMSRLNEALLVAFSAMGEMGLEAVDRVVRIVRALDRLHAAARPLALAVAADAAEPAAVAASPEGRRPAASGARDALPPGESDGSPPDHPGREKRNQTAPQASEKAQNRSQALDPPPASEAFVLRSHGKAGGRNGRQDIPAQGCASFLSRPGCPEPGAWPGEQAAAWPRVGARAVERQLAAIRGGGASVRALVAAGA